MNKLTKTEILDIISKNEGKIFSAKFIKKDGTLRTINCRIGVNKYITGKGLKFNPIERGLLPVFDMIKEDYRFINMDTIIELTVSGTKYIQNYNEEKT